jgi:hypothetical protein
MKAALTSETERQGRPKGLPNGYLSIEELVEKYPDFYTDYMTESGRDRPMRVWIDEDRAVYATVSKKIVPKLSEKEKVERRAMRGKTQFRIVEDRYVEVIEQIPIRCEFPMSVNDFCFLWGDPNYRFDLENKPDSEMDYVKGLSDARWGAYRMQLLDRFRRNPACQEAEMAMADGSPKMMPAKYTRGTFDPENLKYELWGKMPPVYVLPPDSFGFVLKEERTTEDLVWDAMIQAGLKLDKGTYTNNEELEPVRDILVEQGIISETADLTLVRALIKGAQAKNGNANVPATKQNEF